MKLNLILLMVLAGALFFCTGCGKEPSVYLSVEETESATESEGISTEVEEEVGLLYVYVCGAVSNPGVFSLEEGSRICDAIEAAGGFKTDARRDYWNLAMELTDGLMVDVPTLEEDVSTEGMDAQGGATEEDKRVNLNTASSEELMTIPGIGEAKAKAILEFREENGGFSTPEDIMQISGIKEAMYNRIKDYIRVD